MRVLFLLFCLLTIPAFADGVSCTISSTQTDYGTPCLGNDTHTTPGKYGCTTDMSGSNCSICDNDLWCPGDGYAYKCDQLDGGAFPFSKQRNENNETIGAKSKYECYKQLDGGTGNGHGAKCIGTNGEPFDDTCREYYRDNQASAANYKGNAAHHWVSCPNTNHQYDIGEGSGNTLDSAGYHMESTNTECYANKLTCKFFHAFAGNNSATSLTCDSTTGNLVYGTNTSNTYVWKNDGETRCTCDIAGDELNDQSTNNYICTTSETTYRQPQTGSIISSQQTVQDTKIYYSATPSNWTCKSCKAGYVGFFKYADGNNNNQRTCMPAVQGCYSDGCTLGTDSPCFNGATSQQIVFPDPEYYSSQFMCDNIIDAYSYYWDTLKKFYHPCYAGMTTNNTGSTTRNDCHYTNDTQFCDAYGCTSMGQLLQNTGTSQGNWTWYMQQ